MFRSRVRACKGLVRFNIWISRVDFFLETTIISNENTVLIIDYRQTRLTIKHKVGSIVLTCISNKFLKYSYLPTVNISKYFSHTTYILLRNCISKIITVCGLEAVTIYHINQKLFKIIYHSDLLCFNHQYFIF